MRRSIATVCLSGELQEKLQAIAAAGFDAVEIFENDLLNFDGSPREVRRLAEDLGLEIALYQPFRDFEAVPPEVLRRNLDRAERKFDLMGELGAPMMLVCSNVSPAAMDDEQMAADQLAMLADRAAARSIRIGYEALAWGAHVRHVEQVWRIVQRADHPHLGVLLDSFHLLALGDDPAVIQSIPGERIFFVQIADAPVMKMDPLSWSRHYRCFPGQGGLDVAGFVRHALEAGYTGPLSLEIFNDDFRGGSTRQIARDGYRSLLFVEEQVRNQAPEPASAPAHHRRVSLFDPPPPTRLAGISFLEFAVDEAAEQDLGRWIGRFGFERLGRHRHKAVTLFRSGEVNLVLNAEPDSFARSFFLLHGPAVCAVGLRTDDAAQALGRAGDYRCARFDGKVGPNDLAIPAVRALDGSLIHFVDESMESAGLYEIEFDLKTPVRAKLGPGCVDHIALALPSGQLDSWVLYYRAVLGLQAEETLVLPDPYGLVRSRAVVDRERSVRFPLNISLGPQTSTAQSVSNQFGAGVHHIAFGCDDVRAMAARLAKSGAPILHIPRNYYDDLAARFGLSDEYVDELASLNLLYDRVGQGEFLHLYSETFQNRFFFEYVQRLGGYDDYGAPNAQVRMAAHARLRREQA